MTVIAFQSQYANAFSSLARIARAALFAGLVILLTGCGYQLRDSTGVNRASTITELGPLYIDSPDNTPFYSLLRSKLRSASIVLTTDLASSQYRLKVYDFKTQQHPISYTKTGDVSEYRQQASLAFQLTDANNFSAINATRVRAEEIVHSDQNRLAADRAKATQLERELAQKLVDQIYWALKTASIKHKAAQPTRYTKPVK